MNIKILQKGGEKNHQIIENASRTYAKQLMSTRLSNTLNIRIEMRVSKIDKIMQEKGYGGLCISKSNGSQGSREFTIVLQRDDPLKTQLKLLAHEFVHVFQQATNALQYRVWKSDNQMHVRWAGNELGKANTIEYRKRPWEIEAYGLQNKMYENFVAEFYNKDEIPTTKKLLDDKIKFFRKERETYSNDMAM